MTNYDPNDPAPEPTQEEHPPSQQQPRTTDLDVPNVAGDGGSQPGSCPSPADTLGSWVSIPVPVDANDLSFQTPEQAPRTPSAQLGYGTPAMLSPEPLTSPSAAVQGTIVPPSFGAAVSAIVAKGPPALRSYPQPIDGRVISIYQRLYSGPGWE